jgi:hypothetical protein
MEQAHKPKFKKSHFLRAVRAPIAQKGFIERMIFIPDQIPTNSGVSTSLTNDAKQ